MSNNPKLATEKQVQDVSDTFIEIINHQGKQIKALESGVIDAIEPSSPAPTKRGEYKVTKVGVYINFKDGNGQSISVTEEDYSSGNVSIIFNGTDNRKLIVPITFEGEVKEGDTRGVSGNTVFHQEYLTKEKIVSKTYLKDSKRNFLKSELDVLNIIKNLKVYSKKPFTDEVAIETLCGPKFTDEPGRLRIRNITKDIVYPMRIKTDDLRFTQKFKIDSDTVFHLSIDWRNYEESEIVHNRLWSINKNLIFESSYIYQEDFSVLEEMISNNTISVQDINRDLEKVISKKTIQKYVDTLKGSSTREYGASTIYGYSFPIGLFDKPIYGVRYNALVRGNKFRFILLENDLNGSVLYDKVLDYKGSSIEIFFDKPIVSKQNLYVKVISNSSLRVLLHEPNEIFTKEKGFSKVAFTLDTEAINRDDSTWGGFTYSDYQLDVLTDYEEIKIQESAIPNIRIDTKSISNLLNINLRISAVGSSVTWGTGYLQDSMLQYLIPYLQKERTNFIGYDKALTTGLYRDVGGANNIQLFDYKARRIEGVGASLEFDIEGDEISIVQAIDRTNVNASLIDVYIDGKLYDTISNFNTAPIGKETKNFTAVQGQKEYLLERPFTYGHILKVNGIITPVSLSKSMTAPSSGWIIARDLQNINGKVIVQHTLFNMDSSNSGDSIEISYDYGQEIFYEKTTIGKDDKGILENQYGRGYTAFDPANPPSSFSFGSGLDFRETDERTISKYVFDEYKQRKVKLIIKSLDPMATDQSSKPYFIFNFATSRILFFQNAGIGGWKSSQFDDPNNSNSNVNRTWREVVEFQPTHIFYESTPNDDWGVGGYKVYSERNNISLSELQSIRTLPNKEIKFNSTTNDYNYHRWCGYISAIDKWSVTISENSKITIDPKEGDTVIVGTYGTDNRQQIVRNIRSYDANIKRVFFDTILNTDECVYDDLQFFVGKEIQIRDLNKYIDPTESLLAKFKSYASFPKIFLVPNPAPNMLSRDLASYQAYLRKLAKTENSKYEYRLADEYLELENVREWQISQPLNKEITVSASSLVDGKIDLPIGKAINYQNFKVFIKGVDITNKDAYVLTSYCLGVDRKLSGSALNDTATRGKQQWEQFYPTLVFDRNIPISGDIVVKYSDIYWSSDSCHMNTTQAKKLFANSYLNTL